MTTPNLPTLDTTGIDTTFRNSLVNIENLVTLNLDVSISSKDKLKEIFSLFRSLNPKDIQEYQTLLIAVIDMNKCTKSTINRIGHFERKVIKTTHLI